MIVRSWQPCPEPCPGTPLRDGPSRTTVLDLVPVFPVRVLANPKNACDARGSDRIAVSVRATIPQLREEWCPQCEWSTLGEPERSPRSDREPALRTPQTENQCPWENHSLGIRFARFSGSFTLPKTMLWHLREAESHLGC